MSDGKALEPRKTEIKFDGGEPTRNRTVYSPYTDIIDSGEDILVIADLPGADETCVDVTHENNVLTIFAYPPVEKVENYSLEFGEYGVGDFYREFRVNESIDASKITAELADGVLTLRLPKVEAAKPRKIAVKA